MLPVQFIVVTRPIFQISKHSEIMFPIRDKNIVLVKKSNSLSVKIKPLGLKI